MILATAVPIVVASAFGEGPVRVVVVGDSVAYDAEPGIRAALEATGDVRVDTRSYGGVGLLRPGIDGYLADAVAGDPDVVVVMLGGWDLGEVVADPEAYALRLDQTAALLTAGGAWVVWLSMPPTPPGEGIEEARQTANRLFAALADRHPPVVHVDSGPVVGGPVVGGPDEVSSHGFTLFRVGVDGGEVQVRKIRDGRDDGHLCPGGAALLGRAVLDALDGVVDLDPPEDGWWTGAWTGDARYDDPPGGCAAGS